MTDMLQVGDVFTSKSLADANFTYDSGLGGVLRKLLCVGGNESIIHCWTEHGEDGWTRQRNDKFDLNGHDESRGTAEFVVIKVEQRGWTEAFPYIQFVRGKRLMNSGEYDADGEEVTFYFNGRPEYCLDDVVKVREMIMTFTGA